MAEIGFKRYSGLLFLQILSAEVSTDYAYLCSAPGQKILTEAIEEQIHSGSGNDEVPREYYDLSLLPEWVKLKQTIDAIGEAGEATDG